MTLFLEVITNHWVVLAVMAGVTLEIIGGALPGLSPSTAVALFVPFSFGLEPMYALVFLTGIYLGSNYGGSITAILINTPGTPSSAVTAIDGYPMTKNGKAELALKFALVSSCIGGLVGVIILIFFAFPLAKLALKLGPASYFALAVFGLSTVPGLGKGNILKSFLGLFIGLLIATIGTDTISGESRFTFDLDFLFDGFHLVPMLIGLFAVSSALENFIMIKTKHSTEDIKKDSSSKVESIFSYWKSLLRGSSLGTIIGIFPGAGSTIASFISYDMAKKGSLNHKNFGHGEVEGVVASESANSASVGGALIPLLSLGIPGSATDAVLLGAFMLHDLEPGPLLFKYNLNVVYAIFGGLLLANIVIYFIGKSLNKTFFKISQVPAEKLTPLILLLAVIGSYSVSYSLFDVLSCFLFGYFGQLLNKNKIPVTTVVLGFVLSTMIEENLRRMLIIGVGDQLLKEPFAIIMLLITFVMLGFSIFRREKII
ncbi:tripartite tricarboxylate transporter permease [Bacteriovoracaceae bacterium]|nr:tripartite tricarboxylate transporter permease [Bacteriovoracaceae bacterium]